MADLAAAKHNNDGVVEGVEGAENTSASSDMVSVRFDTTTLTSTEPSSERLPEQVNGEASSVVNRPKKSLFEITSVVNTENDFGRGESHGNDVDSELDDTFNETSKVSSPDDLASSSDSQSQSNASSSRFRIVKILRTEPYKKGRWQCKDMLDSENKQPEANDGSLNSGNAPTTSRQGESQAIEPSSGLLHNSAGSDHKFPLDEASNSVLPNRTTSFAHPAAQTYPQANNKPDTALSVAAGLHGEADTSALHRRSSNESSNSGIDVVAPVPAVQPMVNTIETALDQISAIKSTLLSAFNDQVPSLKQTISTLSDENAMLKEENQRLKQALMMERRPTLLGDRGQESLPRDNS